MYTVHTSTLSQKEFSTVKCSFVSEELFPVSFGNVPLIQISLLVSLYLHKMLHLSFFFPGMEYFHLLESMENIHHIVFPAIWKLFFTSEHFLSRFGKI